MDLNEEKKNKEVIQNETINQDTANNINNANTTNNTIKENTAFTSDSGNKGNNENLHNTIISNEKDKKININAKLSNKKDTEVLSIFTSRKTTPIKYTRRTNNNNSNNNITIDTKAKLISPNKHLTFTQSSSQQKSTIKLRAWCGECYQYFESNPLAKICINHVLKANCNLISCNKTNYIECIRKFANQNSENRHTYCISKEMIQNWDERLKIQNVLTRKRKESGEDLISIINGLSLDNNGNNGNISIINGNDYSIPSKFINTKDYLDGSINNKTVKSGITGNMLRFDSNFKIKSREYINNDNDCESIESNYNNDITEKSMLISNNKTSNNVDINNIEEKHELDDNNNLRINEIIEEKDEDNCSVYNINEITNSITASNNKESSIYNANSNSNKNDLSSLYSSRKLKFITNKNTNRNSSQNKSKDKDSSHKRRYNSRGKTNICNNIDKRDNSSNKRNNNTNYNNINIRSNSNSRSKDNNNNSSAYYAYDLLKCRLNNLNLKIINKKNNEKVVMSKFNTNKDDYVNNDYDDINNDDVDIDNNSSLINNANNSEIRNNTNFNNNNNISKNNNNSKTRLETENIICNNNIHNTNNNNTNLDEKMDENIAMRKLTIKTITSTNSYKNSEISNNNIHNNNEYDQIKFINSNNNSSSNRNSNHLTNNNSVSNINTLIHGLSKMELFKNKSISNNSNINFNNKNIPDILTHIAEDCLTVYNNCNASNNNSDKNFNSNKNSFNLNNMINSGFFKNMNNSNSNNYNNNGYNNYNELNSNIFNNTDISNFMLNNNNNNNMNCGNSNNFNNESLLNNIFMNNSNEQNLLNNFIKRDSLSSYINNNNNNLNSNLINGDLLYGNIPISNSIPISCHDNESMKDLSKIKKAVINTNNSNNNDNDNNNENNKEKITHKFLDLVENNYETTNNITNINKTNNSNINNKAKIKENIKYVYGSNTTSTNSLNTINTNFHLKKDCNNLNEKLEIKLLGEKTKHPGYAVINSNKFEIYNKDNSIRTKKRINDNNKDNFSSGSSAYSSIIKNKLIISDYKNVNTTLELKGDEENRMKSNKQDNIDNDNNISNTQVNHISTVTQTNEIRKNLNNINNLNNIDNIYDNSNAIKINSKLNQMTKVNNHISFELINNNNKTSTTNNATICNNNNNNNTQSNIYNQVNTDYVISNSEKLKHIIIKNFFTLTNTKIPRRELIEITKKLNKHGFFKIEALRLYREITSSWLFLNDILKDVSTYYMGFIAVFIKLIEKRADCNKETK